MDIPDDSKFSPQVLILNRYWKGQYIYQGASFDFNFDIVTLNRTFFGKLVANFHDKLGKLILKGMYVSFNDRSGVLTKS